MAKRRMTHLERDKLLSVLRVRFPNESSYDIADDVGWSFTTVCNVARKAGIKKAPEFFTKGKVKRAKSLQAYYQSAIAKPLDVSEWSEEIMRWGGFTSKIPATGRKVEESMPTADLRKTKNAVSGSSLEYV